MPQNAKRAVALVVGLLVMGLLAAILMPTVIGSFISDDGQTAALAEGENVTLQDDLEATLTTVDDTNSEVDVTVSNDADSATVTVPEGQNTTATVDGTDVTVTADSIDSSTEATLSFEYPTDYGWGVASGLWGIIPLFVILPVFMYFTSKAMSYR